MNKYAVGGYVRDLYLGIPSKDLDFSVVAESYEDMVEGLKAEGVEMYLETPEYYTCRGKHPVWGAVDYVWARKEGPYSDGRRPDWVEPGTLEDDLARRDFTMNAIAIPESDLLKIQERGIEGYNGWIDPYDGRADMKDRIINAVGDPYKRLSEDALRAIRALRFCITKDMVLSHELQSAINHYGTLTKFSAISKDRVCEELGKMFKHDNIFAINLMSRDFPVYLQIIGDVHGVWFKPTLEGR